MRVALCLLLATGLLLPGAWAEEGRGRLRVEGGLVLSRDAQVDLSPLLVMTSQPQALESLELRVDAVTVRLFTGTSMGVQMGDRQDHTHVPGSVSEERMTFHNATFRLAAKTSEGLFALNATDGAANVSDGGRIVLRPSLSTDATDTPNSPPWPSPRDEHHHRQMFQGPHLVAESRGTFRYEGGGNLKLHGLDLSVRSDEGTYLLDTTWSYVGVVAHREEMRWAVLEFSSGALEARLDQAWTLVAPEVSFSAGSLEFVGPSWGALERRDSRLLAEGQASSHLWGDLHGSATPVEEDGAAVLALDLEGDLAHTDLREEPISLLGSVYVPAPGSWLLLPLLGGVAVAGYAAGVVLRRRRHDAAAAAAEAPLALTPEDCCALAARAVDRERWPEAAEWLGRARRLAPGSARVCADLAYATAQRGDHEEALALFEEARRLGADGAEVHYHAALAALGARRPPAEAEAWAKVALERSPSLALEMEDRAFDALRGRPGFEEALTEAWDRLAGEAPPPSKPF